MQYQEPFVVKPMRIANTAANTILEAMVREHPFGSHYARRWCVSILSAHIMRRAFGGWWQMVERSLWHGRATMPTPTFRRWHLSLLGSTTPSSTAQACTAACRALQRPERNISQGPESHLHLVVRQKRRPAVYIDSVAKVCQMSSTGDEGLLSTNGAGLGNTGSVSKRA